MPSPTLQAGQPQPVPTVAKRPAVVRPIPMNLEAESAREGRRPIHPSWLELIAEDADQA